MLSNTERREDYDRFGERESDDEDYNSDDMAEVAVDEDATWLSVEQLESLLSQIVGRTISSNAAAEMAAAVEFADALPKATTYTAEILETVISQAAKVDLTDLDLSR